jgi:hypothetical protein
MKSLTIIFCFLGAAAFAQSTAPASMSKNASVSASQSSTVSATGPGVSQSMNKVVPTSTPLPASPIDTTGQASMKKYFQRPTTPQTQTQK